MCIRDVDETFFLFLFSLSILLQLYIRKTSFAFFSFFSTNYCTCLQPFVFSHDHETMRLCDGTQRRIPCDIYQRTRNSGDKTDRHTPNGKHRQTRPRKSFCDDWIPPWRLMCWQGASETDVRGANGQCRSERHLCRFLIAGIFCVAVAVVVVVKEYFR